MSKTYQLLQYPVRPRPEDQAPPYAVWSPPGRRNPASVPCIIPHRDHGASLGFTQSLVVDVSRYMHARKLCLSLGVAGVRDVLTTPEYCAYPPESVVVLDEEAATRDKIIDALKAMCEAACAAGSRTFCCARHSSAS